jgi:hypothetical protein
LQIPCQKEQIPIDFLKTKQNLFFEDNVFENFNIFTNNLISVEAAKVLWRATYIHEYPSYNGGRISSLITVGYMI